MKTEFKGKCNEMISWHFEEETGTLTVSGSGAMPEYDEIHSAPWSTWRDEIREVLIGDGITELAEYGFFRCSALENVIIPSSVDMVGAYCFSHCKAIKDIVLPEGVRVLEFRAFSKCSALEKISIPLSMRAIDKKVFGGCTSLREVVYAGTKEQWNRIRISIMAEENIPFTQTPRRYEGKEEENRTQEKAEYLWFREKKEVVPVLDMAHDLLEQGGDGRFHIVALEMNIPEDREQKVGDCMLLIFPDGQTMLIDTGIGLAREKVMAAVVRMGVKSLDYLLISHLHRDHVENGIAIGDYLYERGGSIGTFYHISLRGGKHEPALAEYLEAKGVNMQECVKEGDEWEIGGVKVRVFGPAQKNVDEAEEPYNEVANLLSIVTKFTYGKSSFMTSGDLYRAQERDIVERYGDQLRADIMKINHHGSVTSNSREWLNTVAPDLAFCQTMDIGSTKLMENIEKAGKIYWLNGMNGDILISMDRDGRIEAKTAFGESWSN